jgi:hypothetical protein
MGKLPRLTNAAVPERKPRTEEISGLIERVTFHNDQSGFLQSPTCCITIELTTWITFLKINVLAQRETPSLTLRLGSAWYACAESDVIRTGIEPAATQFGCISTQFECADDNLSVVPRLEHEAVVASRRWWAFRARY